MKKSFYIIIFLGIFSFLFSSCGKYIHIRKVKVFLIDRGVDRNPNFLFKHKVATYFEKWHAQSIPNTKDELIKLDSLSYLAYEIYENLMSDTILLKKLRIYKSYQYVLVPNKITIVLNDNPGFYYSNSPDSLINTSILEIEDISKRITKKIENFRPDIKNRKCLYFNDSRQEHFYKFAQKYGVKPYVLIDSPLMFGGFRFAETAPCVVEIIIYKNTNFISIIYSAHTSDFESIFKYENKKLEFIKERWELAID